MAARGAKGGAFNGGGDSDSTKTQKKIQLPVFHIGRKAPTKDSVAIGVTPYGDTVWHNTGSRSRGGNFYYPRQQGGNATYRHYVPHSDD